MVKRREKHCTLLKICREGITDVLHAIVTVNEARRLILHQHFDHLLMTRSLEESL
jgi:hypothetical protein